MKTVVQRVRETSLSVDGQLISKIPFGLALYLGVGCGDTEDMVRAIAKKVVNLRIFEDDQGKMNLSVKDVCGEILLISQFTLYGDCSHGNRPSFSGAEKPDRAKFLYELMAEEIRSYGITTKTGVFGADMKILQYNDGPVTIIYEL